MTATTSTKTNNHFTYLKNYSKFASVEEMDKNVQQHLHRYGHEIKNASRQVLFAIAKHALTFVGAAHLKAETIADEIGMSAKSVYRGVKELVKYGILAKENKVKLNGIKGANVYAILPCVPSDVPSRMSYRQKSEIPCERKADERKNEAVSLNLLSTNKSFKSTIDTESAQQQLLIEGLLTRLPENVANTIPPFFNNVDDVYTAIGTIFRAKADVDKSIRIEEHTHTYRAAILQALGAWKQAVQKDSTVTPFGFIYNKVKDATNAIIGKPFKFDNKDKNHEKTKNENIPAWFTKLEDREQEPVQQVIQHAEMDSLEAERQRVLAKIRGLSLD